MSGISKISWSKLEPYSGKTTRSFEELCYQVARRLYGDKGTFTPIDDCGGGDGVEFYLSLPDGTEWGWQAKFYYPNPRLKDSNRKKSIIGSLKKSLKEHPDLKKWFLCTPTKFTPGKGGEVEWFNSTLTNELRTRDVELIHWSESDFLDFLFRPETKGLYERFFDDTFIGDWHKLQAQTEDRLLTIPDKIGNQIHLSRDAELSSVRRHFEDNQVVIVMGPSGCGKTVLAKDYCDWLIETNSQVIWWEASGFDVTEFSGFESRLGLTNSLREVLFTQSDSEVIFVIDSVDRIFSQEAFTNLATILHLLITTKKEVPWKILLTCTPDEWDRVQIELTRFGVSATNWKIIQIREPRPEELEPVWERFPELKQLRLNQELQSLLFKPRILDLIARNLIAGGSIDATHWVGESDLIEWFWTQEVCKGTEGVQRGEFLKKLAEIQADRLKSATPKRDFPISDLSPLLSLKNDRLCKDFEERLIFEDDHYADWARQRILIGESDNIKKYLQDRMSSPLWQRGLRLYGLYLLEKKGLEEWKKRFDELSGVANDMSRLEGDLLLESVILATRPLWLLHVLWPELIKDEGKLLRRLLGRFRYVATIPNPLMLKIFRENELGSEIEASIVDRIPYWWPYWLPMLQFLRTHKEDVIKYAPKEIALISEKWLRWADREWPSRRDAAELALELGKKTRVQARNRGYGVYEIEKDIYKAVLASAREYPHEVANFALEASGRLGKEFEEQKRDIPPPWPDGPKYRVDQSFREVCLNSPSLQYLIEVNPIVAKEVLLALLIRLPHPKSIFDRTDYILDRGQELESVTDSFPAFYTNGPFLLFLNINFTHGLDAIIKLINFATLRWSERWTNKGETPPHLIIELNGVQKKLLGDYQVLYWYRESASAHNVVASALMALEKWLYDKVEKKESIENYVNTILDKTESLALIGVLSAVAKYDPELYLGKLQFLLTEPEFYNWDLQHVLGGENHQMMGWGMTRGSTQIMFEKAQEWHNLPHRKVRLEDLAPRLYLQVPVTRKIFERAKEGWQNRIERTDPNDTLLDYIEKLVVLFDLSNWYPRKHPQHGEILVFELPQEYREKHKDSMENANQGMLILGFPIECLQIFRNDEPLPEEQVDDFWTRLEYISKLKPDFNFPASIEDSIAGGAAVLIYYHRNWLREHPEREKWCIQQIISIAKNKHQPLGLDGKLSDTDWRWDSFCARVIPSLWAENLESKDIRQCVALLATNPYYRTISLLFYYSFKVRTKLGQEFDRLRHFALRLSIVNNIPTEDVSFEASHKINNYYNRLQKKINIEIEKMVQEFINMTYPSELPTLDDIKMDTVKLLGKKTKVPPKLRYIIKHDLSFIEASHNWLPALSEASSDKEKSEWIHFWTQLWEITMNRLLRRKRSGRDESEYPTTWDMWVLGNVASLISNLKASDNPKKYWLPLFECGAFAFDWIRYFLEEFFRKGVANQSTHNSFIREWKCIIDFCTSSPAWSFDTADNKWHLAEMWCQVMGFGFPFWVRDIWNKKSKSIICEMQNYYKKWSYEHLKRPRCAPEFINFLREPGTIEIRFKGLNWIEQVAKAVGEPFWDFDNLQFILSKFLELCWRENLDELRQNEDSFNSFKFLLKKLADFQNTLALETLSKMASG